MENKAAVAVATNQKPKTIKEWIGGNDFKNALRQSLPTHLSPDRFVRVALTAMMKTPNLEKCSQESLFKVLLDLSSLGLEPDGRHCHLIPFENNKTGKTEVQLIIDYKGLIALAKRSGEVVNWRAELVCEKDEFTWENGVVTHKINWLDQEGRGNTLAVYSHVRNVNGIDDYEVMTSDQVNKIKARSKSQKFGPWVTDWDEMAKKTVMRRHSKRLTLSPEFNEALEKDDDKIEFESIKVEPSFSEDDVMPKKISGLEHVLLNAEEDKSMNSPIENETVQQILKLFTDSKMDREVMNDFIKSITRTDSANLTKLTKAQGEEVVLWLRQAMSQAG